MESKSKEQHVGELEACWENFKLEEDKNSEAKVQAAQPAQKKKPKQQEEDKNPEQHQKPYSKKKSKFDHLQEQVDLDIRQKWEAEQNLLKQQLKEFDEFSWTLDPDDLSQTTLKLIGALDISYSKHDSHKAVAALIVCEYPSMKVLYEDYEKETAEYPYVPGFLAFKEIPAYSILFDRLRQSKPDLFPDVFLVDGNGVLHTRNFGCASHIGVLMDVPTIGVGKTVFAVDGLTQKYVKDLCEQNLKKGGDLVMLEGYSGKIWGAALRSTDASKNPIIISIGHRVSLDTAINVVKACVKKVKIPEPIRRADLNSRELVRKYYDGYN